MTDIESQIQALTLQLQELRKRQSQLNMDLVTVEKAMQVLKASAAVGIPQQGGTEGERIAAAVPVRDTTAATTYQGELPREEKPISQKKRVHLNNELEGFIGTNIISKIGILITIIGVFIGVKYAIDKELISPVMRVVAGYLSAATLMLFAARLKEKYAYFSSNLMGGGLAVIYFITYIAYSFYSIFPTGLAFGLMVSTTLAAVALALWYNQRVIALLGQVAAYAIPFLLSNGQGSVFILLGYITIINTGLLILSFRKQWKLLYHIAFFLTWIIYLVTVVSGIVEGKFTGALIFLTINFLTFYATFLSYKILKKELYHVGEIGVLLLNALFFFFIGAYLIGEEFRNVHVLTWFTISNAVVHLGVGYLIYRLRLTDGSVFQFILGLGLLFITISIPIELDGNWVTALWIIEATALCYVARNTSRQLYLEIALPLIVLSFVSLLQDWLVTYPSMSSTNVTNAAGKTAFANLNFILSLFFCTCVGLVVFFTRPTLSAAIPLIRKLYGEVLPVAFIAVLYLTLYNEIDFAWFKVIARQRTQAGPPLQSVTLLIFTCLYFAIWLGVNNYRVKHENLHYLLIVLSLFANAVFLFDGLTTLGELRHFYIANPSATSIGVLVVRYLLFAALALLWFAAWKGLRLFAPTAGFSRGFSTVFNITLLSVISNEFIHWMDIAGYQDQYKLGLSIICGMYALVLLFAGMVRKKKHLRIAAIVLFSSTLVKLFFYDLSSLSTVSKTIVLVLLGVLLLFASFLYNKYKDLLFVNEDSQP